MMQPDQAAEGAAKDTWPARCCTRSRTAWARPLRAWAGRQVDIREAIGPAYSGLEEAKADVAGMFGLSG